MPRTRHSVSRKPDVRKVWVGELTGEPRHVVRVGLTSAAACENGTEDDGHGECGGCEQPVNKFSVHYGVFRDIKVSIGIFRYRLV